MDILGEIAPVHPRPGPPKHCDAMLMVARCQGDLPLHLGRDSALKPHCGRHCSKGTRLLHANLVGIATQGLVPFTRAGQAKEIKDVERESGCKMQMQVLFGLMVDESGLPSHGTHCETCKNWEEFF